MRFLRFLHFLMMALPAFGAGTETESPGVPWLIRTWDSDDGLPQNTVVSLAQTEDGYLWAATLLGGVARFDGVRFVNFERANTPQLRNQEAHLLFTAQHGGLLIAQNGGGVARWERGRFSTDFSEEMPDSSRPVGLLMDEGDTTLYAWQGGGVLRSLRGPDGSFTRSFLDLPERGGGQMAWEAGRKMLWYRTRQGTLRWWRAGMSGDQAMVETMGQVVLSMASHPRTGAVWVGTGKGFGEIKEDRVVDRTPPGGAGRVEQLAFDADGSLWVRGNNQVRRCQDGKWVAEAQGLPLSMTAAGAGTGLQMLPGADGCLWILHRFEGIRQVLADGTVRHPGAADGLPGGLLECGLVDREGSLWAGFSGGGLARVRPGYFQVLRDAGEAAPVVRSICQDAKGSIWVGHAGGRLVQWTGGVAREWLLEADPEPARQQVPVRDVTVWEDQADQIWVGSVGSGAWLLKEGKLVRPFPPQAIRTVVRAGLGDRAGRVWIGSEFGLYCWERGGLRSITAPDGGELGYVLALAEGQDGSLWAGTAKGRLWRWKEGALEHWDLPRDGECRLWALHAAADGAVWIGSLTGGLIRWKDGEFSRLTRAEGLPSDTITQILTDDQGRLWLGSRDGIFSLEEQAAAAFLEGTGPLPVCRSYTRSDGLPAMECSGGLQPACLKASDGKLWFAMVKGAVAVLPGSIPANQTPPYALIEDLSVNGKPTVEPALALCAAGQTVRLAPGDYALDFRFTATSLVAPEKMRFQWQLAGLESAWVDGGAARTARYSFLAPGDYQFRVRATNNDGVWSEVSAPLRILIAPFYWQTGWFRLLVPAVAVLLAGGLIWFALRRRHHRQLEELRRRQALAGERARIARDLHDDLGASLTQLSWLCEAAGRKGFDEPGGDGALTDIGARAKAMVRSIDAIVWAVNPRNDTLDQLAHYICHFAEDFLRGTPLRCRLEVDDPLPVLALDATVRHEAFLMAREAVHNAARHSGAEALHIGIHARPDQVDIRIEDHGIGFCPEQAAGGDGLRNMRTRASAHGIQLTINARPGGGCAVSLGVPLASADPVRGFGRLQGAVRSWCHG